MFRKFFPIKKLCLGQTFLYNPCWRRKTSKALHIKPYLGQTFKKHAWYKLFYRKPCLRQHFLYEILYETVFGKKFSNLGRTFPKTPIFEANFCKNSCWVKLFCKIPYWRQKILFKTVLGDKLYNTKRYFGQIFLENQDCDKLFFNRRTFLRLIGILCKTTKFQLLKIRQCQCRLCLNIKKKKSYM